MELVLEVGMDIWMVIIGHRSSKSTFGVKKNPSKLEVAPPLKMLTGWTGDGVDTPYTVMITRAPAFCATFNACLVSSIACFLFTFTFPDWLALLICVHSASLG